MFLNLGMSAIMVSATVIIHLLGLLLLIRFLRGNAHHAARNSTAGFLRQGLLIVCVTLGVFAVHGVEIWLYALVYYWLGAVPNLQTAIYFSASSYSTLGFGDVVASEPWRIFSSIEGVNGLLLLGWSSAFLLSVTSRLRMLEHDWEKYASRAKPRARKKK